MPYTISTTVKPNDTYTFTYDGYKWTGTIPAGAQSMKVYLWGGGGGGGAQETSGANGTGAGGHYVYHDSIDLTSHVGETITLGIGGGGGGGSTGGGVAGGFNGRSLTGYSGGVGGSSGSTGSSGSGGGGGGATIIQINSVDVALAAGGGAGGGGGADSQGGVGITSNAPTLAAPGTLGENGTPHNGNGGGGGAGGGGVDGGIGGDSNDNDVGGAGGYTGSSLVPSGGTTTVASGQTPAGSPGSGFATGGNQGSSGNNGKAIIIFTISAEAKVKANGAWKTITAMKFKRDGIWKNITAAYTKVNGVWKAIFNTGFNWQSTTAGFGDTTGNPYSGSPGTGPSGGGGGGGGGCSIICTKLHELGYLSDEIYQADEMFGHWLRQTDPNAYYGYLKWARVVVDWMSNEGPQCMFWIQDKIERNARQKAMAVKWARRIATPWAQHMAYKMGVLKEDNRAGRWIMNIGITVSRIVGKFVKHTNQPTKNVAIGYAMWAMFGLLYVIAGVK